MNKKNENVEKYENGFPKIQLRTPICDDTICLTFLSCVNYPDGMMSSVV